ncbi:hypothetical protein AERO9A_300121 [Aeromonas salmonicida]|nr:hypothetical protein AERO9A_300121 [Aeromonas salmonicida]
MPGSGEWQARRSFVHPLVQAPDSAQDQDYPQYDTEHDETEGLAQGLKPGDQANGYRHEQDAHMPQQQASTELDPVQLHQLQGEQHEQQQHADDAAGEGKRQYGGQGFTHQQAGDYDHEVAKVEQGTLRNHLSLNLETVNEWAVYQRGRGAALKQ